MPDSLLKSNLAYLESHASSISLAQISRAQEVPENLKIAFSQDLQPVLCLQESGRSLFIGSSRSPQDEARRQISEWEQKNNIDWNGMIFAVGFAGPYQIFELAAKLQSGGTLIIIDSNPARVKFILTHISLASLADSKSNIVFVVSPSPSAAARELRHYLKLKRTLYSSLFRHPGLFRAFPQEYENLCNAVVTELRTEAIDRGTKAEMTELWTQYAIFNLPLILESAPINVLKDRFKAQTALVAAAGPSLNSAIPYIREAAKQMPVFCVGTAYRTLMQNGICPDFAVAIDSDPLTMKQFPDEYADTDTVLITTPIVYPGIMEKFAGRTLVFSSGLPKGYDKWLAGTGMELDTLDIGGTVSLSAAAAAVYSGCEKIVFCGLDLAFLEDGTTHAQGSMYDGQKYKTESLVRVDGNYGKKVLTSKQFSTYINMMSAYLEDTLKEKTVKFYNATEGGALIRHTELISPARLLELASANLGKRLDSKASLRQKTDPLRSCSHLENTISELRTITKDAAKAAETADKFMSDKNASLSISETLRNELIELNRKIKEKNNAIVLVNGTLETLFMDMAGTADDIKTKTIGFCKHLMGASDWLCSLLENSLKTYKTKNYNTGSLKP